MWELMRWGWTSLLQHGALDEGRPRLAANVPCWWLAHPPSSLPRGKWRARSGASGRRASRASQLMTAASGFVTLAALARNPHRADVRAATTRWLSTLAASEWLRHSTEGYCATTEAAGPDFSAKDCRTGRNGGSVLPPEVVERGWLAAATECISRCAVCERCRFISVSLKERDCRPADSRSYFATISQPVSRSPAARGRSHCLQPSSQPLQLSFLPPPLGLLLTPPRPSLAVTSAGTTRATKTSYGVTSHPSAPGACWATPVRRSGVHSASVSPRTPARSATSSTGCSSAPTPARPFWRGCPPRCRRQPRSSSG